MEQLRDDQRITTIIVTAFAAIFFAISAVLGVQKLINYNLFYISYQMMEKGKLNHIAAYGALCLFGLIDIIMIIWLRMFVLSMRRKQKREDEDI